MLLQKRFKTTIDRSYVVEKEVKDSLAKDQRDIENVRVVLKRNSDGKTEGRPPKWSQVAAHIDQDDRSMTDGEIAGMLEGSWPTCRATIKGSAAKSLVDDVQKNRHKIRPRGHCPAVTALRVGSVLLADRLHDSQAFNFFKQTKHLTQSQVIVQTIETIAARVVRLRLLQSAPVGRVLRLSKAGERRP